MTSLLVSCGLTPPQSKILAMPMAYPIIEVSYLTKVNEKKSNRLVNILVHFFKMPTGLAVIEFS